MKQELKASQEELAKQNQLPNVTMSFEEIGNSALKALKNAKMYTTFTDQIGQTALLTIDDVNAMGGLENEYESNCYLQCKLMPVFREIGLCVVNSERPGFEWLLPLSGNNHFDKRPDFVICNPCFYDVYAKPSVENGVLDVEQRLLGESKEKLLYGVKAGHPSLFLDEICVGEGRDKPWTDKDVGQVKTYASLLAANKSSAFHRIILFDREKFLLISSLHGTFASAVECNWTTLGSKELLQNFFNVPSPLVIALTACCQALAVSPCIPEINQPCILGVGATGVVFRVTPDVNSSTHDMNKPIQWMALKVVVGDDEYRLRGEWELMNAAGKNTERVVKMGAITYTDIPGFGAYLMEEVGKPVETATSEQRKALFVALHGLHLSGVTHGDARVPNAISVPSGIKWIDIPAVYFYQQLSVKIENDFRSLFRSVYKPRIPSEAAVQAYVRIVQEKKMMTSEICSVLELV
mmetsp:Transcript_17443/g.23920  ORF Transcript_17443/g.23920 Transcript_17443/m.23920 type:complete len:465 (+) Transcript_17443:312-1706(+)